MIFCNKYNNRIVLVEHDMINFLENSSVYATITYWLIINYLTLIHL